MEGVLFVSITPIRVSASRLKTFKECQLKFYYEDVVNLPDSGHHKARQGDCMHKIVEHLMHPKRIERLKVILREGVTFATYPQLARYIRFYDRRYKIAPYYMEDMEGMVQVWFEGVKPHLLNAKGEFVLPDRVLREHRFKMQVGAATMSGFIDLLLLWPDRAVCLDAKSQKDKFTRADVPNNIQAAIYQLACLRDFGFIPAVEFVMLRHAPSKRYPKLHIQRVEPPSLAHLRGLEAYIEVMYEVVNTLTLEQAALNPHKDSGFCERVCQFRAPFTYWARVKRDDPKRTPIETYLEARKPETVAEDEALVPMEHLGCEVWRDRA